jgi:hypothetical protein
VWIVTYCGDLSVQDEFSRHGTDIYLNQGILYGAKPGVVDNACGAIAYRLALVKLKPMRFQLRRSPRGSPSNNHNVWLRPLNVATRVLLASFVDFLDLADDRSL